MFPTMRNTDTRERLLAEAVRLIEEHGEAGVKVDLVCAAAGVARPSIYHFFGDREGLVIAALGERYRQDLDETIDVVYTLAQTVPDREQFVELVHRSIRSFGDDDGVRRRRERIQVMGSAVSRPQLQDEVRRVDDLAAGRLAALIDLGKERGWIGGAHASIDLARWWVGLMNGRHLVDIRDDEARAAWDRITLDAIDRLLFGILPD